MSRVVSVIELHERAGVAQRVMIPTPFEVVHASCSAVFGSDVITLHLLHDVYAEEERVLFRVVPTGFPTEDVHVASVVRTPPAGMYPVPGLNSTLVVLHLFREPTLLERAADA